MKKQKILVEKGVNAKVVFKGVVVEVKKINEYESELIFPESLNYEELIRYLETFGIIKRKEVKINENLEKNDDASNKTTERQNEPSEKENSLYVESAEIMEDIPSATEEEKEKQHLAPKKRKRKS